MTSIRQLPPVLVATFAVIGLPVLAVSLLSASGAVDSTLLLVAAGTGLSLLASWAGAALWAKRRGGSDVVFGDLMLWGWLRRRWQERQLASAMSLLGLRGRAAPLSLERRVRALETLATALEARYPDTHGHSRRVARHAAEEESLSLTRVDAGAQSDEPRSQGGGAGSGSAGDGGDRDSGSGNSGGSGSGGDKAGNTPIRDAVDEVTDPPINSLVGDSPVSSTVNETKDTVDSTVGGLTETVNEVADTLPATRRLPHVGLGAE